MEAKSKSQQFYLLWVHPYKDVVKLMSVTETYASRVAHDANSDIDHSNMGIPMKLLNEVFPEDPNIPSLKYAALEKKPMTLPWSHKQILLGTGFKSSAATSSDPFCDVLAFSLRSLELCRPIYREGGNGSYAEATTKSSGKSYEHTSMDVSASVGGKFLGGKGKVSYDSTALENKDAIKSSVQSTCFIGMILFSELPELSDTALMALRSGSAAKNTLGAEFTNKYGDYYVAGMRIGGRNDSLCTAGSDYKQDTKDVHVEVTIHFLFWDKTKTWDTHDRSQNFQGNVSFTGYDSLEDGKAVSLVASGGQYAAIKDLAVTNLDRGSALQGRIRQRMQELKIAEGKALTVEDCKKISEAGLVVELLLLPYSGLRDYASARLARPTS